MKQVLGDEILKERFPDVLDPLTKRTEMGRVALHSAFLRQLPFTNAADIIFNIATSLLTLELEDAFKADLTVFITPFKLSDDPRPDLSGGEQLIHVLDTIKASSSPVLSLFRECPLHGEPILRRAQKQADRQSQNAQLLGKVPVLVQSGNAKLTALKEQQDQQDYAGYLDAAVSYLSEWDNMTEEHKAMGNRVIPQAMVDLHTPPEP